MPLTGKLNSSNIFVTRVKKESVTDKTAYQYWDGANWNPTFTASPEAVVFSSGQGSLSYNNHYNTYFYLYPTGFPIPSSESHASPAYCTNLLTSSIPVINVVVSPVPQGPWSDPVTIYNCTMGCYGPAAQPYFDPSGKTLILDVSIWAAQFYTQTASLVCFLLSSPGLLLLTKSFRHSIELRGFLSDGFHEDDSLRTFLYSIYISIIE